MLRNCGVRTDLKSQAQPTLSAGFLRSLGSLPTKKCSFSVYSFLPGSFHERHEALFTQSLIRRVIAKASEFEAI